MEAASDTVGLNRRDDDRIQRFHLAQRRFPVPEKRHGDLTLRQRGEIDAAAERAARAADDHDPQAVVAGKIVDQRVQVACPLLVGAVQHVRTVQDHRRDAVVHSGIHGFELHPSSFLGRVCHGIVTVRQKRRVAARVRRCSMQTIRRPLRVGLRDPQEDSCNASLPRPSSSR